MGLREPADPPAGRDGGVERGGAGFDTGTGAGAGRVARGAGAGAAGRAGVAGVLACGAFDFTAGRCGAGA